MRLRRKRRRLRWWNFWTVQTATVYQIRVKLPGEWWSRCGYVGQTTQVPWTDRIADHLWGGAGTKPKVWADTVPGWGPYRNVAAVVAAGGARRVARFPIVPMLRFLLNAAERWGVTVLRPCHNVLLNHHNPRRVSADRASRERRLRDVQRRVPVLGAVAQCFRLMRQLVALALICTLIGVALTALI